MEPPFNHPPPHGFLTRIWHSIRTPPPPEVSLVGLDAAGKTTLGYKLADRNEDYFRLPLQHYQYERHSVIVGKRKCEFWPFDLGGPIGLKKMCEHFAKPCTVFLVDSNDRERMDEVRMELHWWASIPVVQAILVVCNKQDLPNAQSVFECANALDLESLPVPFFVTGFSALFPADLDQRAWPWLWLCIDLANQNPMFGRTNEPQ